MVINEEVMAPSHVQNEVRRLLNIPIQHIVIHMPCRPQRTLLVEHVAYCTSCILHTRVGEYLTN